MKLNSYSVNSECCFILILMHDRLDAIMKNIDSMDSLASHMFFYMCAIGGTQVVGENCCLDVVQEALRWHASIAILR